MSEPRVVLLIVVLLAAMCVAAAIGMRLRAGAIVLALVSIVWLLVDTDFEGRVLLSVTDRNGLTSADLVGLAGLAVACAQFYRLHRRS